MLVIPREDVSRETIAKQIALALRDEVDDLQKRVSVLFKSMSLRCVKGYHCAEMSGGLPQMGG